MSDVGSGCSDEGSYIDFAFGSDVNTFASVYRFRVKRTGGHDSLYSEDNRAVVTVEVASLSCNPLHDRPLVPQFLHTVQRTYLKLLFRDGMAEIINLTGEVAQL